MRSPPSPHGIPYSQKYWWELNLAVESHIAITNILARFKFSGSVQDRHTHICEEEILTEVQFGGWLEGQLPNCQIFRLYGS